MRDHRRRDLLLLLTGAWAVRVGVALLLPNQQHADEIYEYVEAAYRVVTGRGLVAWEFQYAARPWLLPYCLVPIVWLASLTAFTRAHLQEITGAVLAIAALAPVAAAYLWASAWMGRRAAWVAGVVAAGWFELVYQAPKATQEGMGGACLVLGLLLLYPRNEAWSFRRKLAGGLLLGLAVAFRVHLAPTVLVAVWLICGARVRDWWRPVSVGMLLGLVPGGLADWIGWSYPFEGYLRYIVAGTVVGVPNYYGVKPFYYYASQMVHAYSIAIVPIAIAVVVAARRYPVVMLTGLSVFAIHSMIGQKVPRFIVPGTMLLVPLASIGIGALAVRMGGAEPRRAVRIAIMTAAGSLLVSAGLAAAPRFRVNWTHRRSQILAFHDVSAEGDACGVGVSAGAWSTFPGESGLRRALPIFEVPAAGAVGSDIDSSYNYLAVVGGGAPPPAFQLWRRYWTVEPDDRSERVDVYKRPGACDMRMTPLERLPVPSVVEDAWGAPR